MTHWSENSQRLQVNYVTIENYAALSTESRVDDVGLLILPSETKHRDVQSLDSMFTASLTRLGPNATLIVLGRTQDLVSAHTILSRSMRYQLWISIKGSSIFDAGPGALPNHHFDALVYTNYHSSLRHCKTRVPYTFCPACDRTTKDYGGKKHTYHEYGTLVSDVWRDISCDLGGDLSPVIGRFADLFGLPEYKELRVFDCRSVNLKCVGESVAPQANSPGNISNQLPDSYLNSLLVGDCLERLRELPDNSIDFAFADPPYNLGKHYSGYSDNLENTHYHDWCDEWIDELARVIKPGKTCVVLNIPLLAARHFNHMATVLKFQNWITWDALAFPVRLIMPAHYALLCFSKGPSRDLPGLLDRSLEPLGEGYCLRTDCIRTRKLMHTNDREPLTDLWWDIHRLKHNTRRVDHPCQLPPQLMNRLISLFTFPKETVLDCFNGAGTTTLTAAQLGRNYVGIELSQQYHDLASERHQELASGLDPFRKANRPLTAKNSPVPRMPKQKYAVSKKALQLEVRRIARSLGRLPTRDEVILLSRYSIDYYDQYFVSWGEVCAAARTTGMVETRTMRQAQIIVSQANFLDS